MTSVIYHIPGFNKQVSPSPWNTAVGIPLLAALNSRTSVELITKMRAIKKI